MRFCDFPDAVCYGDVAVGHNQCLLHRVNAPAKPVETYGTCTYLNIYTGKTCDDTAIVPGYCKQHKNVSSLLAQSFEIYADAMHREVLRAQRGCNDPRLVVKTRKITAAPKKKFRYHVYTNYTLKNAMQDHLQAAYDEPVDMDSEPVLDAVRMNLMHASKIGTEKRLSTFRQTISNKALMNKLTKITDCHLPLRELYKIYRYNQGEASAVVPEVEDSDQVAVKEVMENMLDKLSSYSNNNKCPDCDEPTAGGDKCIAHMKDTFGLPALGPNVVIDEDPPSGLVEDQTKAQMVVSNLLENGLSSLNSAPAIKNYAKLAPHYRNLTTSYTPLLCQPPPPLPPHSSTNQDSPPVLKAVTPVQMKHSPQIHDQPGPSSNAATPPTIVPVPQSRNLPYGRPTRPLFADPQTSRVLAMKQINTTSTPMYFTSNYITVQTGTNRAKLSQTQPRTVTVPMETCYRVVGQGGRPQFRPSQGTLVIQRSTHPRPSGQMTRASVALASRVGAPDLQRGMLPTMAGNRRVILRPYAPTVPVNRPNPRMTAVPRSDAPLMIPVQQNANYFVITTDASSSSFSTASPYVSEAQTQPQPPSTSTNSS